MQIRIHDGAHMNRFAADYVSHLVASMGSSTVVALSGDLGAGKTTFAQAVAKSLGVEETVNSPTFVIQKVYALSDQQWGRLIHIDAYRLKSADELRALGWDEMVGNQ